MSLKAGLFSFVVTALGQTALAQAIAPPDWTLQSNGTVQTYAAPNGIEMIIVMEAPTGVSPSQVAEAAVQASARTSDGGQVKNGAASTDAPLSIYAFNMTVKDAPVSGEAFGVKRPDGKVVAVIHMGRPGSAGFASRLSETRAKAKALAAPKMADVVEAIETLKPRARVVINKSPPPLEAPKAGAYSQSDVLHYLFDLSYTYGVGGMAMANYQPVAIFKDGTAVMLGGIAVEDVNVAVLKRTEPGHVGTWRKVGAEYHVRYVDGETAELKMRVGPAFPWPSAQVKLQGSYKAIGGRGNTAIGGGVMTFEVEDLSFYRDGSFGQSNFRGGTTPNTTNAVKSGKAGTWRLDGSTLTLAYRNGQTYRTPLLYSGKKGRRGRAEQLRVVWIGGEDYRRKK